MSQSDEEPEWAKKDIAIGDIVAMAPVENGSPYVGRVVARYNNEMARSHNGDLLVHVYGSHRANKYEPMWDPEESAKRSKKGSPPLPKSQQNKPAHYSPRYDCIWCHTISANGKPDEMFTKSFALNAATRQCLGMKVSIHDFSFRCVSNYAIKFCL